MSGNLKQDLKSPEILQFFFFLFISVLFELNLILRYIEVTFYYLIQFLFFRDGKWFWDKISTYKHSVVARQYGPYGFITLWIFTPEPDPAGGAITSGWLANSFKMVVCEKKIKVQSQFYIQSTIKFLFFHRQTLQIYMLTNQNWVLFQQGAPKPRGMWFHSYYIV